MFYASEWSDMNLLRDVTKIRIAFKKKNIEGKTENVLEKWLEADVAE